MQMEHLGYECTSLLYFSVGNWFKSRFFMPWSMFLRAGNRDQCSNCCVGSNRPPKLKPMPLPFPPPAAEAALARSKASSRLGFNPKFPFPPLPLEFLFTFPKPIPPFPLLLPPFPFPFILPSSSKSLCMFSILSSPLSQLLSQVLSCISNSQTGYLPLQQEHSTISWQELVCQSMLAKGTIWLQFGHGQPSYCCCAVLSTFLYSFCWEAGTVDFVLECWFLHGSQCVLQVSSSIILLQESQRMGLVQSSLYTHILKQVLIQSLHESSTIPQIDLAAQPFPEYPPLSNTKSSLSTSCKRRDKFVFV